MREEEFQNATDHKKRIFRSQPAKKEDKRTSERHSMREEGFQNATDHKKRISRSQPTKEEDFREAFNERRGLGSDDYELEDFQEPTTDKRGFPGDHYRQKRISRRPLTIEEDIHEATDHRQERGAPWYLQKKRTSERRSMKEEDFQETTVNKRGFPRDSRRPLLTIEEDIHKATDHRQERGAPWYLEDAYAEESRGLPGDHYPQRKRIFRKLLMKREENFQEGPLPTNRISRRPLRKKEDNLRQAFDKI